MSNNVRVLNRLKDKSQGPRYLVLRFLDDNGEPVVYSFSTYGTAKGFAQRLASGLSRPGDVVELVRVFESRFVESYESLRTQESGF